MSDWRPAQSHGRIKRILRLLGRDGRFQLDRWDCEEVTETGDRHKPDAPVSAFLDFRRP